EMVGRRITPVSRNSRSTPRATRLDAPILMLDSVTSHPADPPPRLSDVSLQILAGELVGIAGVDGNGQAALIETVLGLRRFASGKRTTRATGIAHIADDRQREA